MHTRGEGKGSSERPQTSCVEYYDVFLGMKVLYHVHGSLVVFPKPSDHKP